MGRPLLAAPACPDARNSRTPRARHTRMPRHDDRGTSGVDTTPSAGAAAGPGIRWRRRWRARAAGRRRRATAIRRRRRRRRITHAEHLELSLGFRVRIDLLIRLPGFDRFVAQALLLVHLADS